MSAEGNHTLSLTIATDQPTISNNKNSAYWPSPGRSQRRRRCIIYYGCCTTVIAILAVSFLVVSLTVYKVREPKMTLNSFIINQTNLASLSAINMTVLADISAKNRNAVTFKFGASTTMLFYRGQVVGLAYGPSGTVRGHRTFRVNVTMDVMTDRLLNNPNLAGDLLAGSLGLETFTRVGGKVKIFGLFKHHVDVMMNCTVTISVSNQAIIDQNCTQRVKL